MQMFSGYWATAGSAVLALCCLIGIVVFAMRSTGRARVFGILGCAFVLVARLIGFGAAAAPMAEPSVVVTITFLTTVFTSAGFVLLSLSFLRTRRVSLRNDVDSGDHPQGGVST